MKEVQFMRAQLPMGMAGVLQSHPIPQNRCLCVHFLCTTYIIRTLISTYNIFNFDLFILFYVRVLVTVIKYDLKKYIFAQNGIFRNLTNWAFTKKFLIQIFFLP